MKCYTTVMFIEKCGILGPVNLGVDYSDRLEGAESTLYAVSADFKGELNLADAVWMIAIHFNVKESDLLELYTNGQILTA